MNIIEELIKKEDKCTDEELDFVISALVTTIATVRSVYALKVMSAYIVDIYEKFTKIKENRKGDDMVKTLTLVEAVEAEVNSFVKSNEPFSVHQITTNIRNRVNDGEYNIPDTTVIGMPFKYAIEHPVVKGIFKDLQDMGEIPLFNTHYNGLYVEYSPVPKAVISKPTSDAKNMMAKAIGGYKPLVDKSEAKRRIFTYVDNSQYGYTSAGYDCGNNITMKKIQSGIKRGSHSPGLSCRDIFNIVEELGYSVDTSAPCVSKWFVR